MERRLDHLKTEAESLRPELSSTCGHRRQESVPLSAFHPWPGGREKSCEAFTSTWRQNARKLLSKPAVCTCCFYSFMLCDAGRPEGKQEPEQGVGMGMLLATEQHCSSEPIDNEPCSVREAAPRLFCVELGERSAGPNGIQQKVGTRGLVGRKML